MAETVSTGGAMQFRYKKGHHPKPSKEYKLEINNAYSKYYERKKKEKKRKTIIWILIIITIIILLLAITFLRSS
ncbi:MAG: hypothetical protein KKD94_01295 [Nanoarchaeota archaeon]|nr:hypothetical protein [Nanoarchaeota archaeon]MBU1988098.1 hypothetical protein [Nanoarchaeota archaeon]